MSQRLFIVGIGASAGGLEALQKFFQNLPSDSAQACFIIAQHLSPTHRSHLVDLLSRQTQLQVSEAEHEQSLKAGVVYITPPDREIQIQKGHLVLEPALVSPLPKPSVDRFFQSLAQMAGSSAIGIILSGTGSDGALGVQAIKKEGGLVIVQEPQSAKYDGMPLSALNTGDVDLVLAPEEMGNHLLEWLNDPSFPLEPQPPEALRPLHHLIDLLSREFGTDFSLYKQGSFQRRLKKRIASLPGISDLEAYIERVIETPQELHDLFQDLLIGVTAFFRDADAFAALQAECEKLLKQRKYDQPIRIWVPGCASGEEAYSIAIMLHQILGENLKHFNVQIFATDLDTEALKKARTGVYPAAALAELPDDWRMQYFNPLQDNQYEVIPSLRNIILFSRHDVTHNPPFLKLDLISCRNLLIYFSAQLQQHVLPIFHYALNPDALLFLGKSESVGSYQDLFQILDLKHKIFRRKSSYQAPQIKFSAFRPQIIRKPKLNPVPPPTKTLQQKLQETLYQRFPFPFVVVNEDYQIQELHGNTEPFLKLPQGHMHNQLLKMVHSELQIELRTALNQSLSTQDTETTQEKEITWHDQIYWVKCRIEPVFETLDSPLLMVIFEYRHPQPDEQLQNISTSDDVANPRILELERELASNREHLQTYIEELEVSNEELQSLNEELQSTNEELQSTNEELETSNEELQSTNEENQVAYRELQTAHKLLEEKEKTLFKNESYQEALLANTQQGFILIDRRYQVLKFNTAARSLLRLIQRQDLVVNTSFLDYLPSEYLSTLKHDLQQAFDSPTPFQKEYIFPLLGEEQHLLLNYCPIKEIEGPSELISISLMDMSEYRRIDQELRHKEQLLSSVYGLIPTGIGVQNPQGHLIEVNRAFCTIFGYTQDDLLGQHISLLLQPEARQECLQFYRQLSETEPFKNQEWRMVHKDGHLLDIFLQASLLPQADGQSLCVNAVTDISEPTKYKTLLEETQMASHVGGWELDLVTQENTWTPEVYKIYDVPDDYPVNVANGMAHYHPDDQAILEAELNQAIERGIGFNREFRFISHIKKSKWVRVTCQPVRDHHRTTRLYGTIQDITRHKQNQEQLEGSRAMLMMATHLARIAYWDYGFETQTLTLNTQFTTLLGDEHIEKEFTIDAFMTRFVLPEQHKAFTSFFSALDKPHKEQSLVIPMQTFDGEVRYWQWFVAKLDSNTSATNHIGAVQDIHAFEEQTQTLNRSIEQLTQQNQQLKEFSHIVSHNLRNPLSNIKGLLQLIEKRLTQTDLKSYLELLNQVTDNMDNVLGELHQLLSLEHQPERFFETFAWSALWQEVQEGLQPHFEYSDIQIQVNFEVTQVHTVRSYTRSILQNLVHNAIKYRSPERPLEIAITTEPRENGQILIVADNGVGLEMERIGERVFQIYQRFHPQVEGRGLGLYMSKTQIESLGGKIWVESELDQGSRFYVFFPEKTL